MRLLQFAVAGTEFGKRLDELPALVELHDARIAEFRPVPFGNEDVAIARDGDAGWLNVSRAALPAPCPALPSVIRTLPSGPSLVTCMPLPFLASPSTAQTLPSLSAAMPCGKTNRPAPKFFIVLPSGPSSKMGEAFELEHPASSQRSNAQRSSLESTVTASGCDQGRGVAAQFATNL